MASKQPILTDKAPKPLPGIYSQAIVANGFVFCSGQVPMDPATSKLVDGDVAAHTHQCIKNLGAVLEASGSSLDKVVEVNVFLADMADFAAMNDVYKTYFGEVKPSRTQVPPPCPSVLEPKKPCPAPIRAALVCPVLELCQMPTPRSRRDSESIRSRCLDVSEADFCNRCVAVKTLPLNTDVEIKCVAVL